jgi:hypothetical protein
MSGQRDGNPLVESESPERENAKAKNLESTEEIGTGNSLIESETQEQNETPNENVRRKAREGEYKGSVRSLRTQQRAKSQRQIDNPVHFGG